MVKSVTPKGDGLALFIACVVLIVISWITVITRIGVRVWKKVLGADDWIMVAGLVLFTVTALLCATSTFYGSGQKAAVLPADTKMKGIKTFFVAEFFYATSAAVIKCSIAMTLLRIADSRKRYVYSLWTIMIATALAAVIFNIVIATMCHPVTALWGETAGTCDLTLDSDISFFFSAVEIATDWSLAILPAILLWNIQMKTRLKVTIGLILGLAAFASCATIVRLEYLSLYSNPAEFMYSTGKIGLWSIIEEGVGITAGSLHALRPLLSLPIFGGSAAAVSSGPESANKFQSRSNRRLHSDVKLDTFQPLDDMDGDCERDCESQKHILKQTHVSVTNEQFALPGEWERNQVLGWKQNKFSPTTE